jgi:hypothetical protein
MKNVTKYITHKKKDILKRSRSTALIASATSSSKREIFKQAKTCRLNFLAFWALLIHSSSFEIEYVVWKSINIAWHTWTLRLQSIVINGKDSFEGLVCASVGERNIWFKKRIIATLFQYC